MKRYFLTLLLLITLTIYAKDYRDLIADQKNSNSLLERVGSEDVSIKIPDYIFENTNTKIELQFANPSNNKLTNNNYTLGFFLNGQEIPVQFDKNGYGVINHSFKTGENINVLYEDFSFEKKLNVISIWMIVAPVGLVLLLIVLRILNQRAKRKIAAKTLSAIEASKQTQPALKAENAPLEEEEELLA